MQSTVSDNEAIEFEVDRITGHADGPQGLFYKVKWKGYPEYMATREPSEHCSGCEAAISDYWDRLSEVRTSKTSIEESFQLSEDG
jgi:hypothetical protein